MIELYDYQKQYIEQIREQMKQGNKRVVLCAPTGSGKTVMFSFMVSEHIKKGGRVIVFTHRAELLKQAGGSFEKFGLEPDFIKANHKPDLTKSLHVAMIETFNVRKNEYDLFLQSKTLIIFDEAHLQNFTKVMDIIPEETFVIGATATPFRPHKQFQMGEFYNALVQELDTEDVIELGKLTPAKSYGVEIDTSGMKKTSTDYNTADYYEDNKTYEGVVKNWEVHSKKDKTILFASNIKSSEKVCYEFVSKGYNAKHIDGKMSKKERESVLKWFEITPDAVLCNCGILTAGFDQSDILTVILYRATTSLPLFLQMCGRGSRLHEGKDHFKILDFGNNIARLGFWEDRRQWKLNYKKKEAKESIAPKKICPKCDAIVSASAKFCEYCLFKFPQTKQMKEEVTLQELKKITTEGKYISELTIEELILLQKTKKFKAPFIWRVVRSRSEIELLKYAAIMKYTDGWVWRQSNEPKGFTNIKVK